MSGLIKAGAANTKVSAFVGEIAGRHPRAASARELRSPVEQALDEAHNEIARLQAALLSTECGAHEREVAARRAGHKAGAEEVQSSSDRRLQVLGDTVATALGAWDKTLAALDALAVAIARDALAKIFTPSADLAELTTRAIVGRIAALEAETVVSLSVSVADFPDASAIEALHARLGRAHRAVERDAALGAGEARIALRLGHIDVGPMPQWRTLDDFLQRTVGSDGEAAR